MWREITLGDVSDEDERDVVRAFVSTARAQPALAAHIEAVRIVKPYRPPAGPRSESQREAEQVLATLSRALSRFPALRMANLVGNMVAALTTMEPEDAPPNLTTVTLSGPPSDAFLGLRNFAGVETLRLDHPWLATPAFLDRVHIQLANVTALHVGHFALPTSHPALTFLLGGAWGKRLTELSLHLSPDCPSPSFPTHLLAQVPNLAFLSLSAEGVDVACLPILQALRVLNLHNADADVDHTLGILSQIAVARAEGEADPLPALRAVRVDVRTDVLARWRSKPGLRAILDDVWIRLEGPDDASLDEREWTAWRTALHRAQCRRAAEDSAAADDARRKKAAKAHKKETKARKREKRGHARKDQGA